MILKIAALLTLAIHSPAPDTLYDYVRAQMRWQQIPGLSLAVMKNGKILKSAGYGHANLETPTAATPRTVYKIGSVSKILVASGVLLLVHDGRINLDAGIRDYLPEAPESRRDIRVRHLLSHTSGLIREIPDFDPYKRQTLSEQLSLTFSSPLSFPPGTKWVYSNVGYFVLAQLISRTSGQDWESFLRTRLLEPAGMKRTLINSQAIIQGRARGYETRMGQVANAEDWLAVRPSGAYLSTVLDFARIDEVINLLTPKLQQEMWTPVKLTDGKSAPYGLGWFVNQVRNHRHVFHGGGVPGFVAEYHRFPDDGLSVVIMANIGNRDLSDLAMHVAGRCIPDLLPPPQPSITDSDPTLTKKLRALVEDMSRGQFLESLFSSQEAKSLRETLAMGFGGKLKEQGRLQQVDLLERRTEGANLVLRYRFKYRYLTLFGRFVIGPEGKVERWMLAD